MQRRRFGRSGLSLSVLGFGAGAVGGLMTKGEPRDQERAIARSVELGINYIDTAPLYGDGESERVLGRVLKALKPDIVLGTKVRLKASDRSRIGAAIAESLDASLARLGRDHVDLFQLHNPVAMVDANDTMAVDLVLGEVAGALDAARRAGKTRFVGFSGVGEPAQILRAAASGRFDGVQIVYNALNPTAGGTKPEGMPGLDYGDLLGQARKADMGTIVIRALAGGALSGTTDRHALAMQIVPPIGSGRDFATDVERARRLAPLLEEAGAASLGELAMRFVIGHPDATTMLVGYSTLDHLEEAAAAVAKGPLPAALLARIGG